jgi:RNA polymerase sigma-70 factor (ECF subfamily)
LVKSKQHNEHVSDFTLVERFKTGDMKSLGVLYERYAHLVIGVCLKYLGDRELAKDACIDVFEQLMVKLKKHEVTNFKSWLYSLSKNHCLMKLRKAKTGPLEINGMEKIHEADDFSLQLKKAKEAQFERLEEAIAELNDGQQQCVREFYLKAKPYKVIATELNMDIKSVKSNIQNAKRNLKNILEKQHEFKQRT